MFDWLLGRKTVPAVASKPAGFFSTDADFRSGDVQFLHELLGRSIQRTPADFKMINPDGSAVAMDSGEWDENFNKPYADYINAVPPAQLGWFASQGFIGYQIAAIIAQHWLVDKACLLPARDAMRHGYELTANDDVVVEDKTWKLIKRLNKKMGIDRQCVRFVHMGRVFGIRIALPVVEYTDPDALAKPFNIDGVRPGSYKGITQIDPYWMSPELDIASASDPASLHFYEPTWWRINGKRVHRSHLIIFRNGELADVLKPTYLYGGVPVPQKIAERVYAAERTANEAPALSLSKRTTSVKVNDIDKAMANQQKFDQRMTWWTQTRDNYGVKILGEGEELNQYDTSLADFDATIMTQYQLVAAGANVPATELLGTSPKGFNATGEFEMETYNKELETVQSSDMEALIDRHHLLLMKSYIIPKLGIAPFEIIIDWNPVDSPTAEEQANIDMSRSTTAKNYSDIGALDGQDVRDKLRTDKDSGWNGLSKDAPVIEEPLPGNVRETIKDGESEDGTGMDEAPYQTTGFDPVRGTLNGARLITHQRFLDQKKVNEKIASGDYTVNVTPPFVDDNKLYRMVIDGHHSLAAAMQAKVIPTFVTEIPRTEVFNAATREATDQKD